MILEGLVTTLNERDELNVAPMGPLVNEGLTQLILRPFRTSTTYQNLKMRPCGVFHVTDDVLLIAQAALDRLTKEPRTESAHRIVGRFLADCCRWYEFQVTQLDDSSDRTVITATVIHTGKQRDFLGFNRAKHAVLEATILATRLHLIPAGKIHSQLAELAILVEKTAGAQEKEAFGLVNDYVSEWYCHEQSN